MTNAHVRPVPLVTVVTLGEEQAAVRAGCDEVPG
jgi:hypothetical protein